VPEAQQIYGELILALLDEFVNDLAYGFSSSLCVAPYLFAVGLADVEGSAWK